MRLRRIHWHWAASSYSMGMDAFDAYHFSIDGLGAVHEGRRTPEDNINIRDGIYAAHTRAANTGAIGVSLLAMAGAEERPFDAGRYPIKPVQIDAMAELTAKLCRRYSIPVSRETTLSHAEVEPTLGIEQNGKWDIVWLPGMSDIGDPIDVGDKIRAMVSDILKGEGEVEGTPDAVAKAYAELQAAGGATWRGRKALEEEYRDLKGS